MADPQRRILLVMHNWMGYLHGVQLGIAAYLTQRPDWTWTRVLPLPQYLNGIARGSADGVITYSEKNYVDQLRELDIPVVDVSNWWPPQPFPSVLADDEAVGRLAAEYFLDLGLRHFGTIGPTGAGFSEIRQKGFASALEDEEIEVSFYRRQGRPPLRSRAPVGDPQTVLAWLQSLPKPVGIFASHDPAGAEILEICRHSGIRVPEEVCVLGVDNDELVSKFSHPPLSSIALPTEKIGFAAAKLLDELMSGAAPPAEAIMFPPVSVISRQSTNLLNINDPEVLEALRYIRERVHEGVTVQKLLKVVTVNRRYLERKFLQHLGRTPLQEIRRVRIEKAKQLLSNTDLSMPAIAKGSGFSNPERMANVFRNAVGMTASAYRRSCKLSYQST
ncbi:MAG TPA: substrate-binding domain-containing protein [Tepidisphaeraceae bacterium]|jgi:LacI family transcriptional regulator|nr:substrate-binding domain-containing protein [Tepidisphaeraceae bacterium]